MDVQNGLVSNTLAKKSLHQNLLLKDENYYKTILDSTNDIFILTKQDAISDFNAAFVNFFLKNSDSCAMLPDTNTLGELFEKIDKYGFIYDGYMGLRWYQVVLLSHDKNCFVGVKKNDKLHIFNISVRLIDESENIMIITMTEITNVVEHKHELEKEFNIVSRDNDRTKTLLAQYQSAIDKSNLVSKTDTKGNITYVNDAFCTTLKYSREELIGKNHVIVRSPRMSDETFEHLWQSVSSGKTFRGVIEDIDSEGNGHYFNSTVIPIYDEESTIVEYLAIRQDVSEIFAAKLEASRALEVRTNFLNQVSHELRTPLNAMINFVGQVLDDYDDILTDESFRKMAKNFLQRAQNNSKNLLGMINTLLDAAKLESGKEKFAEQRFDLTDLLQEIHGDTQSLVRNKDIAYELKCANTRMFILADRQKLRQVIVNIISNSIKFTASGSVMISTSESDDSYILKISDTGCGIPSEKLDSIFEPFTQVNTHDQGTGLGLTLVKAYCDAMLIDLSVESQLTQGTTFLLEMKKR